MPLPPIRRKRRAGLFAIAAAMLGGLIWLGNAPPAQGSGFRDRSVPMTVQTDLDIERYQGLWFEIARYPNRFERDCVAVTAEYALREDGQVMVRNSCRKNRFDGPLEVAEGRARVEGPGRLSVNFVRFLPFIRGDYYVLDVTPDYAVAVVGEPSGRFGWILARQPRLAPPVLERALSVLERNGYDISELYYTPHP
ncbi:MAG: lipocalin family protein [Pararhodobacter sp.]